MRSMYVHIAAGLLDRNRDAKLIHSREGINYPGLEYAFPKVGGSSSSRYYLRTHSMYIYSAQRTCCTRYVEYSFLLLLLSHIYYF